MIAAIVLPVFGYGLYGISAIVGLNGKNSTNTLAVSTTLNILLGINTIYWSRDEKNRNCPSKWLIFAWILTNLALFIVALSNIMNWLFNPFKANFTSDL